MSDTTAHLDLNTLSPDPELAAAEVLAHFGGWDGDDDPEKNTFKGYYAARDWLTNYGAPFSGAVGKAIGKKNRPGKLILIEDVLFREFEAEKAQRHDEFAARLKVENDRKEQHAAALAYLNAGPVTPDQLSGLVEAMSRHNHSRGMVGALIDYAIEGADANAVELIKTRFSIGQSNTWSEFAHELHQFAKKWEHLLTVKDLDNT